MISWLEKLKLGLTKTSNKIITGIDSIFSKRKLDDETSQELEDLLIEADLGVDTSHYLVQELIKEFRFDKNVTTLEIKHSLSKLITDILSPLSHNDFNFDEHSTNIIIMCGVNGNGKTTSVAKLANYYAIQGKKVMLAACDTFRAAAVDQLCIWADRLTLPIVTGKNNADPASIAYKAIQEAKTNNIDLLFLDTAGRLHNKEHLMAELNKIIKVVQKVDADIMTKVILVLDATTGQNAILQLEKFKEIADISGIIVTKLDGSAKAGVIISIARKHQIPIIALGVGEGLEDLKPFSAKDFADSILGISNE
jgi:fused signal recognition particle receptor